MWTTYQAAMTNLCNRCEEIFSNAKRVLCNPDLAEQGPWIFGSYQKLQQNAEKGSQCQLCCIIFSLRRQDAVNRFLQDGNRDELAYTFDFVDENRDLLFIDVFPSADGQQNVRLFSSRVRFRKSERKTVTDIVALSLKNCS